MHYSRRDELIRATSESDQQKSPLQHTETMMHRPTSRDIGYPFHEVGWFFSVTISHLAR